MISEFGCLDRKTDFRNSYNKAVNNKQNYNAYDKLTYVSTKYYNKPVIINKSPTKSLKLKIIEFNVLNI